MASACDDPHNFGPLYERYFPRIYAYCLRRTGRPEVAEDLTSAVFTRALAGLAGYRGGSVGAWLFQITHNVVANHWRGRRPDLSLDPSVHLVSEEGAQGGEGIVTRLVEAEERQRVARLIAALPRQQQEILLLTIHGELSAKEVGAIVGKSEGAVWVALHRITRRLRQAYQESEKEFLS